MLDLSVRFWRALSLVLMLALAVFAGAAFQQATQKTKFTEIDVERINVVEADGTVKLVIANHDRAPDQVKDGRSTPRRENNKAPGITFFNDTGDEAGGLKVRGGRTADGTVSARGHLLFDQHRGDQTIGFIYDEENGRRTAGMTVWDRPEQPITELMDRFAAVAAMPDGPAKAAAQRELDQAGARGEFGVTRVFAGKTRNRDAMLMLADTAGRERIRLIVPATGEPRIEFVGTDGRVTSTLPASAR